MSAAMLRATFGTCPDCHREVMADGWNRLEREGCYWCGSDAVIPCRPRD